MDYATKKYGGMEGAMAIGGNEVSGYHTGPASIVGQLVGFATLIWITADTTSTRRQSKNP